MQCPRCSLLYRRSLPSATELPDIYGPSYFRDSGELKGSGYQDYVADANQHRSNAARRLDAIENLVAVGRLFDVGCAAGFFLAEARSRGWETSGIDVAASMVAHARNVLGLNVREGRFGRQEVGSGRFDCVTMWDYIEHSIDPVGDLRAARSALRPGGILALTTGDAGSLVARASGRRWHLLTPRHHNFFFTTGTLTAALEAAGFDVVHKSHPSAWYSASYLVHKLRTLADIAFLDTVARRLARRRVGGIALPVNLFDTVFAIARPV